MLYYILLNYNKLYIYYQTAFSSYKYRIWPSIHDQVFCNSKSELWKKIKRQWLIILKKKSILQEIFQVTYYNVYSWEESNWKDKYIKKLSYSEQNKAH